MRRGFKYSVTLLSLLACLSLFAIGFASWTILLGIEVEASIEGNIGSEDVIYSNDYVSYEIDSSRMFKYCRYGFVKDDEIVNEGTLPLSIELKNLASFKDRYIDLEYDSIKVVVVLKYDNSNSAFTLFDTLDGQYSFTPSAIFKDESYTVDSNKVSYSISANECDFVFDLDNILNDLDVINKDSFNFSIDYLFKVLYYDPQTYFRDKMFETLNKSKLFSLSVKIEGYKAGDLNA